MPLFQSRIFWEKSFYTVTKWLNSNFISTDIKCPGDSTCSNQGTCDVSNGTCVCDSGFQGDICQGKNFL